ncbi:MAG: hypothetical protein IJ188_05875 [Clostridia bacterium]|nr:hypothetical protein [Clostridia bacterium]MBQ9252144.1 hypothetical protein [Clostridia bacterium]
MLILLFGVSNVGKTTAGKLLAERLALPFHDLDAEVCAFYETTLEEFVNRGTLEDRDRKRGLVMDQLTRDKASKVIAVTPISYIKYLKPLLKRQDVIPIELRDTPENIFERLVFSDEDDVAYEDNEYKEKHRVYYLREIREDLKWYGKVYEGIPNKLDMNNAAPEKVVEDLMKFIPL